MFDPIHYGHLRTAFELQSKLSLDEVRFVPCADPPHRGAATVDTALRVRMVDAAIRGQPGFLVDDRESKRPGPSYTVDTLTGLRADFPDASLCLIVGMDAFLGLPTWRDWHKLLDLAHIVVVERAGCSAPEAGALRELIENHATAGPGDLRRELHGGVHLEQVTRLEISSTGLRSAIRAGLAPRYLMPDAALNVISETGCYAAQG
ncbi:nicotinate-nucleotide adenylyltransferase [Candidatus Rariloculus sp.]|uniref:nicotinate-nucleotide adenylyltransferase n=1 Tax=Candidatus Rariloculus sp. TaxID=3101265 RepID=UPI003D106236